MSAHHRTSSSLKLSLHELNALAADVVRLSQLLTRDRESLPSAYLKDKGLRKAYEAYFLPANIAKIHAPLSELSRHPAGLLSRERLRILDIGSGPGTSILGMLSFFAKRDTKPFLEFTALDQVAENLNVTEALFASHRDTVQGKASLKTLTSDISKIVLQREVNYDIIILSNVLNELFQNNDDRISKRITLLQAIISGSLAPEGSCIIIEPALRETSRDMLQVRDGLLVDGLSIYAPCLHAGACPACANPRDWCHEDIPWDPPGLIKEVDRIIGLRKDSLKFSYLVIRKDAHSLADCYRGSSYRVVSEPLVSKGKQEYFLCNGRERKLATRQDKNTSEENRLFNDLKRGDIVEFDGLIDEGKRFTVAKETVVELRAYRQKKIPDKPE